MRTVRILLKGTIIVMVLAVFTGCTGSKVVSTPTPEPPLLLGDGGSTPRETPPATLAEAISVLSDPSSNYQEKLAAIETIIIFREDSIGAVPTLIDNLDDSVTDVREKSAVALGEIGPNAKASIPALSKMLLGSGSTRERRAAADALRKIGDKSAVPLLIEALSDDSVAINAAKAIGTIANEDFRDLQSTGYRLENGVPLIVLDARAWWQEKGRFLDWS